MRLFATFVRRETDFIFSRNNVRLSCHFVCDSLLDSWLFVVLRRLTLVSIRSYAHVVYCAYMLMLCDCANVDSCVITNLQLPEIIFAVSFSVFIRILIIYFLICNQFISGELSAETHPHAFFNSPSNLWINWKLPMFVSINSSILFFPGLFINA